MKSRAGGEGSSTNCCKKHVADWVTQSGSVRRITGRTGKALRERVRDVA